MLRNIMRFLIRIAPMKRLACFARFYNPRYFYGSFCVIWCIITYLTIISHDLVRLLLIVPELYLISLSFNKLKFKSHWSEYFTHG